MLRTVERTESTVISRRGAEGSLRVGRTWIMLTMTLRALSCALLRSAR